MTTNFIDKEPKQTACILTSHSTVRASQRGIKEFQIRMVTKFGRVIRKQGLRFFYMTHYELKFFPLQTRETLQNLVVVMAGDENMVITTYKNKDAIRHIKRKSKRLIKN